MVSLLTAITGISIFLLIGFLVLFVLGFFIKSAKRILWIIAFLLLMAGIYFIFRG